MIDDRLAFPLCCSFTTFTFPYNREFLAGLGLIVFVKFFRVMTI